MTGSKTRAAAVPDYDEVWDRVYGDMQDLGPVHRHMRRILAGMLAPLEFASAIDVGCGAGHNIGLLRAAGDASLAGVDVSARALRRAATRWPEVELHQADIEKAGVEGRWDLVFCSLVLEHLPDDRAALRQMHAMAGRHLLLTTIGGDFERYRPWEEQMGHVRNYASGELEAKVAEAGFRVEQVVRWGFPFYSPLVRTLQNRMTAEPGYGLATRILARATYLAYHLNSARRGDVIFLLASI